MSACGTYAGYNRHQRNREQPCQECRAAATQYARDYRAANPAMYRKDKERTAAQSRALWRLSHMYRKDFLALVKEELTKENPS